MIQTNKLVRDKVCQVLADRGIAKKTKMRYTKCTCRKSIRSKRISKTWVVHGSVGDGNGKKP